MLHLHSINFHGAHPQLGQHRTKVITLLGNLSVHVLPHLVLVDAGAVAIIHHREDKPLLRRLRRSYRHSRRKGPGVARHGPFVLLTLHCQLVQFFLVLELLLLVVLDVLVVPVHGELGAGGLRGQDDWGRGRTVA